MRDGRRHDASERRKGQLEIGEFPLPILRPTTSSMDGPEMEPQLGTYSSLKRKTQGAPSSVLRIPYDRTSSPSSFQLAPVVIRHTRHLTCAPCGCAFCLCFCALPSNRVVLILLLLLLLLLTWDGAPLLLLLPVAPPCARSRVSTHPHLKACGDSGTRTSRGNDRRC